MLVVAKHKTILWANGSGGGQRGEDATGNGQKCSEKQGDDLFHKWMD